MGKKNFPGSAQVGLQTWRWVVLITREASSCQDTLCLLARATTNQKLQDLMVICYGVKSCSEQKVTLVQTFLVLAIIYRTTL